jgi:hypothetical protein
MKYNTSMPLGSKTEEGLKHLFMANSEDHLLLLFSSEAYEAVGKTNQAKELKEKAFVELGHAKGILEKIVQYNGINYVVKWYEELKSSEVPKEEPKRFMHYATLYMMANLLAERKKDSEAIYRAEASRYYELSRKAFQDLLDSGLPPE